jgi:hypothetical protein
MNLRRMMLGCVGSTAALAWPGLASGQVRLDMPPPPRPKAIATAPRPSPVVLPPPPHLGPPRAQPEPGDLAMARYAWARVSVQPRRPDRIWPYFSPAWDRVAYFHPPIVLSPIVPVLPAPPNVKIIITK